MAPREIRLEPKGRPALRPAAAKHLADTTRKEERKKAKEQQDASKKSAKKKARDEKKAAKKGARAVAPVLKKLSSIKPGAAAKTVEELQERVARAKEKLAGGQSGGTKPWDKLAAFVDKVRDFAGAGGAPGKGGPPPAFDGGAREENEAADAADEAEEAGQADDTSAAEGEPKPYELHLRETNKPAWKQLDKSYRVHLGRIPSGKPAPVPGKVAWKNDVPWQLVIWGLEEIADAKELGLRHPWKLDRIPDRANIKLTCLTRDEVLVEERDFESHLQLLWDDSVTRVRLDVELPGGRRKWSAEFDLPPDAEAWKRGGSIAVKLQK